MDNIKLKEYDYLRSEIMQKIELNNTLLTFTITTTVAILTLALSLSQTILYLLPFCVIVPMSMRTAYYKSGMMKLSAYAVIFLEGSIDGLNWETRNANLIKGELHNHKSFFHNLTTLRYYEFLILSIVCYIFYTFDYLKDKQLSATVVIVTLLPLLLVLWEVIITIQINSDDKHRQKWIQKWTVLKEELNKN